MATKRNFSIKKNILHIFSISAVVLATVLSIYMYTTVKTSEEQFAQASQSTLKLFATEVQIQTNATEAYMIDLALHSEAFRRLGETTSSLQSYQDAYEIWLNLPSILNNNNLITGIILYSPDNEQEFARYNKLAGANLQQRAKTRALLQSEIIHFLQTGPVNTEEWFFRQISDHMYWLRVVRYQNVSIVAIADLNLLQCQAVEAFAFSGDIQLLNDSGQPQLPGTTYPENSIRWTERGYGRYHSGNDKFLVFSEAVGNLEIRYVQSYRGSLVSASALEAILLFCVILSILAILLLWIYIRRTLFHPLDVLVATMEQISRGELTARPSTDYQNLEFQQVNDTFNTMIEQITALKIDSYEKQLAIQKSEMVSLKLQIRPHFFLNCLKNLYAFAQIGRIGDIQKMILLLSSHLRYVFSYQTETVQLQQELELCKNYLELCSLGQAEPIQWYSEISQSLRTLPVPTVSILTFIENCAQYAIKGSDILKVTVVATRLDLESGTMANISISDNGPGFTQEQLESLNQLDGTQMPQLHVGIINVLRRFRLLYGENFAAAFTNKRDGGAKIDLFLPLNEVERSQDANEVADCR